MRSKLFLVGLLLILAWMNTQILFKEQHRVTGKTLILELAPVDPRSLMQGDYMILRYKLAGLVPGDSDSGVLYLKPNAQGLATELQEPNTPGCLKLKYRRHDKRVEFGIESYLFQEGQAAIFDKAKYSEVKVTGDGTPSLIRLLDENFKPLGEL